MCVLPPKSSDIHLTGALNLSIKSSGHKTWSHVFTVLHLIQIITHKKKYILELYIAKTRREVIHTKSFSVYRTGEVCFWTEYKLNRV